MHSSSSTASSAASSSTEVQSEEVLQRMDTAASTDINGEWSRLLRSLQQQDQEALPTSSHTSNGSAAETTGDAYDEASALSAAAEWEKVDGDASSWQEVGGYAAEDAATRNSWKAMYGPGALAEWGGLVSSSSRSTRDESMLGDWDSSSRVEEGSVSSGLPLGITGSAWFGVLESPFAAAAGSPFPDEGLGSRDAADAAASAAASISGTAVTDSMDTCHGSDAEDVENAYNNRATSSMDGSSSSSDIAGSDPGSGTYGQYVLVLDEEAVRGRYGGLAPVRVRVLLQQLLSGTKLSLLMSGRQEEALAVIRWVRWLGRCWQPWTVLVAGVVCAD
jgi:hypothetical protein